MLRGVELTTVESMKEDATTDLLPRKGSVHTIGITTSGGSAYACNKAGKTVSRDALQRQQRKSQPMTQGHLAGGGKARAGGQFVPTTNTLKGSSKSSRRQPTR